MPAERAEPVSGSALASRVRCSARGARRCCSSSLRRRASSASASAAEAEDADNALLAALLLLPLLAREGRLPLPLLSTLIILAFAVDEEVEGGKGRLADEGAGVEVEVEVEVAVVALQVLLLLRLLSSCFEV